MTRYAGRNAILPPLNGFAAQFAGAVGGLVFVEYVFSYPGRRTDACSRRRSATTIRSRRDCCSSLRSQ